MREELHQEFSLSLDCRTCWNSLLEMLKSFLKIKTQVQKALIDENSSEFFLNAEKIQLAQDLVNALEIVEVAATELCGRDVNLLKADQIFEFMFSHLRNGDCEISQSLFQRLLIRVNARRHEQFASLLRYLRNPREAEKMSTLDYPPKSELPKIARDVFMKLPYEAAFHRRQ